MRQIKRGKILAALLCGALLSAQVPEMIPAEGSAEYAGGICEHHPEHTPDCGYQEAAAEQPCRHEHTKECYEYKTVCVHEHTEGCYPLIAVEVPAGDQDTEGTAEDAGTETEPQTELVRGSEPTACTHVCSEESGCVTKTLNCIHADIVNADGSVTYAVHDAGCGYAPAVEGKACTFVCKICSAPVTVQTSEEGTDPSTVSGTEETENSDAETETDEAVPDDAVAAVQALIDALPSVEEVEQMTQDEQKEVYDKAQDAADAYFDELTEEQQEQVDTAKLEELMDYFNGQVSTMADAAVTVEVYGETEEFENLTEALEWMTIDLPNNATAAVTLNQDTTLSEGVQINGNVTFIGNGYKVTYDMGYIEVGGGVLTIINVINVGEGRYNYQIMSKDGGEVNVQGGSVGQVYANGGKFTFTEATARTIDVLKGIVKIDGGTIKTLGTISGFGTSTIEITGGNIQNLLAEGGSTIKITGGNIDKLSSSGGEITISGGTIKKVTGSTGSITYDPTVTVSIDSVTAGKITVVPLDNTTTFGSASYSLDGENWQDSNVLDCKSDTEYTVYARYEKAKSKIGSVGVSSDAASYTVSIPSDATAGGAAVVISADTSENKKFDLGAGGRVAVSIESGTNGYGGTVILTEEDSGWIISSQLSVDGKRITDGEIGSLSSADDKLSLSFSKPTGDGGVIPAGTYKGRVTFELDYRE